MTEAEWAEFRAGGIGSSEASIIMGASPFMDIETLWQVRTGRREPQEQTFPMRRGIRLEPIARNAYHREADAWCFPVCVIHPTIGYMRATLDGFNAEASRVLEIKCPGKKDHATALEGTIPGKYIWQLVHQLAVTGASEAHYYSFDGEAGVTIPFQRDAKKEELLIAAEMDFWECVQTDTPPVTKKAAAGKWDFPVRKRMKV